MSAPGEQVVIEPMKLGLGATSFNKEVKSFIPKGKMVTTAEEFPDLDDAFDEKPKQAAKKKKEKKVVKKVEEVEEECDMSVPWRGKPSSFFVMNQSEKEANEANPYGWEMNDEQWKFIFKHYPEYGAAPYDMMTWLYAQVFAQDQMENQIYQKPGMGGEYAGEDEEESGGMDNKYDKAFGPKK